MASKKPNRNSLAALSEKKIVQSEIRDIYSRKDDNKKKKVGRLSEESFGIVKGIISRFEGQTTRLESDETAKTHEKDDHSEELEEKIVLRNKPVLEKNPNEERVEEYNSILDSFKGSLEVQAPWDENIYSEEIEKAVGKQPEKCSISEKSENLEIQIDLPEEIKNVASILVTEQITKIVPTTLSNFELNFNGFSRINSEPSNFGSYWENNTICSENIESSDGTNTKIIILPILLKPASLDQGNPCAADVGKNSCGEDIKEEDVQEILSLIEKSGRRIKELSQDFSLYDEQIENGVDEEISHESDDTGFEYISEPTPQMKRLYESSEEKGKDVENRDIMTSASHQIPIRKDNGIFISLIAGQHNMPENWNFGTGPTKTLWQELPDVKKSGILNSIENKELKLRESLFEIVTSECSYAYGLKILIDHFMAKIRLRVPYAIDLIDYNSIFPTDIYENILKATLPFLDEILTIVDNDIKLHKLSDCVRRHYLNNKSAYIAYFQHSKSIIDNLNNLYIIKKPFKLLVDNLSADTYVNKLSLMAYIGLPMQRITRLPLLMKNVISQADPESEEFLEYAIALKTFLEIADDCNLEQHKIEQQDTMRILEKQLRFPDQSRKLSISTASRVFLMSAVAYEVSMGAPIREEKHQIIFHLFNDAIIIAKKGKKKDKCFWITDLCLREVLQFRFEQCLELTLLILKMGINIRKKTEMRILFESEDDRKKIESLLYEEEKTKFDTDITVVAVKKNDLVHPDEMQLVVGDVINVSKNRAGWHFGERLQDKIKGWFPEDCCKELIPENKE